MDKARKFRIIGVVLLIICFITAGIIIAEFIPRKEAVDKIIEGLSWEDIWNGVDQTLRTECMTPTFNAIMIISVPLFVVALIFITLSEKIKLKFKS